MKYKNGYIELEEIRCSEGLTAAMPGRVRIIDNTNLVEIEGKIYYTKKSGIDFYPELLASELAKYLNVPCADYDVAFYGESFRLISEVKDTNSYSVDDILKCVYQDEDTRKYTNLSDIRHAICRYFKNSGCDLSSIIDELNNIYLFDILLANPDRNASNLKVTIRDDEIHFVPLYDNANIFSHEDTTYDSNYTLGVSHEKKYDSDLVDYLNTYPEMVDVLLDKLEILSPNCIETCFKNIENKIGIETPDRILKKYINAAMDNQASIRNIIKSIEEKTKTK